MAIDIAPRTADKAQPQPAPAQALRQTKVPTLIFRQRPRGRSARGPRRRELDPREQLGRPEDRAGAADRLHADRRLSRADSPASGGVARFLERGHVQSRRILGRCRRTRSTATTGSCGRRSSTTSTSRPKTSTSPTGRFRCRTSTRSATRTSARSKRPAASTCRFWASAARGISVSTSPAARATAARGWSRSTRSRGRTRPATSSAKRTSPASDHDGRGDDPRPAKSSSSRWASTRRRSSAAQSKSRSAKKSPPAFCRRIAT